MNAGSVREVVFTRNASEALNLVANTLAWKGPLQVGEGDEVLITEMEHHSNIVPWQMLCAAVGARLKVAPIDDRGELLLEEFAALVGPRTRIVAAGSKYSRMRRVSAGATSDPAATANTSATSAVPSRTGTGASFRIFTTNMVPPTAVVINSFREVWRVLGTAAMVISTYAGRY